MDCSSSPSHSLLCFALHLPDPIPPPVLLRPAPPSKHRRAGCRATSHRRVTPRLHPAPSTPHHRPAPLAPSPIGPRSAARAYNSAPDALRSNLRRPRLRSSTTLQRPCPATRRPSPRRPTPRASAYERRLRTCHRRLRSLASCSSKQRATPVSCSTRRRVLSVSATLHPSAPAPPVLVARRPLLA